MAKPFDMHRYVETLGSADVSEGHALASAQALTEALGEAVQASLLTNNELLRIKIEINSIKFEARLLRWLMAVAFAGLILLFVRSIC